MKVSKHIVFNQEKLPKLKSFLDVHGISYKALDTSIVFDIFDDDDRWEEIAQYVEARKVVLCLSETHYTKKELSEAEWLQVRSIWRNGYPQPESRFGYRNLTYSLSGFCSECGCGLIQRDSFRLKAAPKWGSRHIFTLNWVDDELFVDTTAQNILQHSGLSGFHFLPVKNKSGIVEFPDVKQIMIENRSKPGIVLGNSDIDIVNKCDKCGSTKYHPTGIGMHSFSRKSLSDMPDICHSYEQFGEGVPDRLILIRQSMYRTIIDSHLERSLVFEPIKLV